MPLQCAFHIVARSAKRHQVERVQHRTARANGYDVVYCANAVARAVREQSARLAGGTNRVAGQVDAPHLSPCRGMVEGLVAAGLALRRVGQIAGALGIYTGHFSIISNPHPPVCTSQSISVGCGSALPMRWEMLVKVHPRGFAHAMNARRPAMVRREWPIV